MGGFSTAECQMALPPQLPKIKQHHVSNFPQLGYKQEQFVLCEGWNEILLPPA